MGAAVFYGLVLILVFLELGSGSDVENKRLPLGSIKQTQRFYDFNDPYFSATILDDTTPTTIPTINPTNPSPDTPPMMNPTPPTTTTPTTMPPATPTTPPATPTTPGTTTPTGPGTTTPTGPGTTTPTGPAAPTGPGTMTPTGPGTTTPTSPGTTTPSSGGGSWCIANPSASEKALQVALDYACGYGGADCSAIQPGGSCYNPNTVHDHASYAFNDYYQKNPGPTSCAFGGSAQLANTDPSSGSCRYTSKGSSSSTNSPPMTPSDQTPPGTPMTQSPPNPYLSANPGGSSVYGAEPTTSPNMAASTSQNILILFSTASTLMYILLANHP